MKKHWSRLGVVTSLCLVGSFSWAQAAPVDGTAVATENFAELNGEGQAAILRHDYVAAEGYFREAREAALQCERLDLVTETTNSAELLVFTSQFQVYKTALSEFSDSKASVLGDYLPTKLGFDEGESVVKVCLPGDYSGFLLFAFENGKVAKVALSAYDTKSNRRRLTGAYSDKSPLKSLLCLPEEKDVVLYSTDNRALVLSTALMAVKTTRTTIGVAALTLRKKALLDRAVPLAETRIQNATRYRSKALPAAGAILKDADAEEPQLSLDIP